MDQRKNDGLRHLIPFLTRQKSKLLFLFLMALFNAVLTQMPIQLIALMVDLMTGSSHPMMRIPGLNHVYGAFLAFVLVYALARCLENVYSYCCTKFSDDVIVEVREEVMHHALTSLSAYRQPISPTDIASRISSDRIRPKPWRLRISKSSVAKRAPYPSS